MASGLGMPPVPGVAPAETGMVRKAMPKESNSIMSIVRTPLGIVVLLLIMLVLASLTVASAISGSLTAAAVSSAGLIVIIVLLVVVNVIGK